MSNGNENEELQKQLDELRKEEAELEEYDCDNRCGSVADTIDGWFEENLGKSFSKCKDDNSGAYMTSGGGYWLSPKVVTQMVEGILQELDIDTENAVRLMQVRDEIEAIKRDLGEVE